MTSIERFIIVRRFLYFSFEGKKEIKKQYKNKITEEQKEDENLVFKK